MRGLRGRRRRAGIQRRKLRPGVLMRRSEFRAAFLQRPLEIGAGLYEIALFFKGAAALDIGLGVVRTVPQQLIEIGNRAVVFVTITMDDAPL